MSRINPIDPENAQGKAKQLLDGVRKSLGMTPNLMRALANSPASLEAYLGLLSSLDGMSIDAKTRESIALATSGANGCEYCAAAPDVADRGRRHVQLLCRLHEAEPPRRSFEGAQRVQWIEPPCHRVDQIFLSHITRTSRLQISRKSPNFGPNPHYRNSANEERRHV